MKVKAHPVLSVGANCRSTLQATWQQSEYFISGMLYVRKSIEDQALLAK